MPLPEAFAPHKTRTATYQGSPNDRRYSIDIDLHDLGPLIETMKVQKRKEDYEQVTDQYIKMERS